MKRIIIVGMVFVMMLVSLGGCYIGFGDYDRDEGYDRDRGYDRGGGHDKDGGHDRGERHDRGDEHEERH